MWLLILETIPKAIWNCIIVNSLIRKHTRNLNEHIIYYNFSFLIEQIFWNLSTLLQNLAYCFWIHFTVVLSTFSILPKSLSDYFFSLVCLQVSSEQIFSVLCGVPVIFLHPAVSHIFHMVQVFLGPAPGSRFYKKQFNNSVPIIWNILETHSVWLLKCKHCFTAIAIFSISY